MSAFSSKSLNSVLLVVDRILYHTHISQNQTKILSTSNFRNKNPLRFIRRQNFYIRIIYWHFREVYHWDHSEDKTRCEGKRTLCWNIFMSPIGTLRLYQKCTLLGRTNHSKFIKWHRGCFFPASQVFIFTLGMFDIWLFDYVTPQ